MVHKYNFFMSYLDCYDSLLLRSVAHFRPERLKEYHNSFSNLFNTGEDNIYTLKELVCWENEICFNDNCQYITSMWEVSIIF